MDEMKAKSNTKPIISHIRIPHCVLFGLYNGEAALTSDSLFLNILRGASNPVRSDSLDSLGSFCLLTSAFVHISFQRFHLSALI